MIKNIVFFIFVLFILSCSEKKPTLSRAAFQSEIEQLYEEIEQQYSANKKLRVSFLAEIKDSTERKLWDETIYDNYRHVRFTINKIEEVSYILMLQADSMSFYYMDTTNVKYLKNYNESKNTAALLQNGLGKVIAQYLAEFDAYIVNTARYDALKLPKCDNENTLTDIWMEDYPKINSLAEFEETKLYLHKQIYLLINKRIQFYKKVYSERHK